jgi:N-acetyl-1-D-myo-inositol-2-amino-2-deoxy-alpha-D-glucopyranoside deacetylase
MLLLAVVAHPDDESFGCGSILLHAGTLGYATAVLCATRGEAGESRVATDDLAACREEELRAAARILGVGRVRLLDHADSGMTGAAPPGSLAAADPEVVAAQVAAVLEELRPEVVVTLDAADGHRDHAVIRDATLAAVDAVRHPPAAAYLWCLARSSMTRWADHRRSSGAADAYASVPELGTPDAAITTVIDVAAHVPVRWRAIRAHASQASPYDDLPEELQQEFLATDRLQLVRGEDRLAASRESVRAEARAAR